MTMRRFLIRALALVAVLSLGASAYAQAPTSVQQSTTRLDVATLAGHTHGTGGTITITPPGGQYVYVTGLDIADCAGASAVTPANPTFVTVSNIGSLAGVPQWMVGSGQNVASTPAAGVCQPTSTFAFATPLKSAVSGTNVVFTLPAFAANQTISLNVYYYFAP